MEVRCQKREMLTGNIITYTETINSMSDYVRARSALIGYSSGFIDDVEIVKNGQITDYAYNSAKDIVQSILNG